IVVHCIMHRPCQGGSTQASAWKTASCVHAVGGLRQSATRAPARTDRLPAMRMTDEHSSASPPESRLPQELQSLVAQLHGAHIVIDADYRIVAANDAYRAAFQVAGDVVGRHC